MAPAKASRGADDHRPDAAGPKDRSAAQLAATKMRRGASQTSVPQLRDTAAAPTSAPVQGPGDVAAPALDWSSFDREALHTYCRQHQLNTPPAFSSTYHQWVLSQPSSIGLYSPTMVAKRKSRRQSKEQLAMAVRKHFNGMGIQENDVIVDFMYRIRCEKSARANGPNKQAFLATK